jgi:protein-S-isoprenylcysteine O-methyltransferase Ste14
MTKDTPLIILAVTVCSYWMTVLILAFHKRLRHGQRAGLLPRQGYERRLWLALVPVVAAWCAVTVLACAGRPAWLALPSWATAGSLVDAVRWLAAVLAVGAYLASLGCWWRLGRSWSLAVVPEQRSRLVTEGVYCWVRHPIYSLNVLLALLSAVVLPTWPMAALACLHLLVMHRKAGHEERHLVARFGDPYTAYCREVGRFWPRLLRRAG